VNPVASAFVVTTTSRQILGSPHAKCPKRVCPPILHLRLTVRADPQRPEPLYINASAVHAVPCVV